MMALALPFAYMHARAGMVGVKVFLGIMLGIFFHMLNSLFSHIGLLQNWPPFAAAVVPSAAFLARGDADDVVGGAALRPASHEARAGEAVVQELPVAVERAPTAGEMPVGTSASA